MAFAAHDLGNIVSGFDKNGNIIFLDKYQANGAEERSKQIAEHLISKLSLNDDQKRKFLPLIAYLIDQTKFLFDEGGENKPFARFVRVVDQIGGNLFNSQDNRVIGLIFENVFEQGTYTIKDPNYFFNFVINRFPQLVGEESKIKDILSIWGKELPQKEIYIDKPITIKESDLP